MKMSFFFFFFPQWFYTLTFDAQVLIIWPTIYSPYATLRTDHFLLPFQKQQIAIVDAIYRLFRFLWRSINPRRGLCCIYCRCYIVYSMVYRIMGSEERVW
jgi:hypothetical protein